MGFPMRKDEYRPSVEEVADSLLESDKFKAALTQYLIAQDGPTKWREEARLTFAQMVNVFAAREEDYLIEKHFEVDGDWEHA